MSSLSLSHPHFAPIAAENAAAMGGRRLSAAVFEGWIPVGRCLAGALRHTGSVLFRRARRGLLVGTVLAAGLALGAAPLSARAQSQTPSVAEEASPTPADPRAAPEIASGFEPKPEARGKGAMIAAAHPLAAEAGRSILSAGGSAVDAAIAAQAVLGLVEPQSSGFGGGGFALHYDAQSGALTAWDGRETAPLDADPYLFWIDDPDPEAGGAPKRLGWREAVDTGLSVGTPGLARMLALVHARHGRREWADLFAQAITLAEDGFEVTPRMAASIERARTRLAQDPAAAALFLDGEGAPLAAGAMLRNPELGATLRALAELGPRALHGGPVADAIVTAAQRGTPPGRLSRVDLAVYSARERAPVCSEFRGRYEVCGMGPPSSGAATVSMILGQLQRFESPGDPAAAAHLFLEASKRAYADRAAYLADSDFVAVPLPGLLDAGYLAARAETIAEDAASTGRAEAGTPPGGLDLRRARHRGLQEGGTTHLSVVDAEGDIFVMTSSVETAFGAARVAAGMVLNNQLTDFSFAPVAEDGRPIANAVAPGKRPRSSMAPTIVFDISGGTRRPVLALGSPGGSRIIEYVVQTITAILDRGVSPADALSRPHVSQRNRDAAQVENRPDADALAEELAALGHQIERAEMTSGLHVIALQADGTLVGAADPRREGVALLAEPNE